jgi:hypothetical protein
MKIVILRSRRKNGDLLLIDNHTGEVIEHQLLCVSTFEKRFYRRQNISAAFLGPVKFIRKSGKDLILLIPLLWDKLISVVYGFCSKLAFLLFVDGNQRWIDGKIY